LVFVPELKRIAAISHPPAKGSPVKTAAGFGSGIKLPGPGRVVGIAGDSLLIQASAALQRKSVVAAPPVYNPYASANAKDKVAPNVQRRSATGSLPPKFAPPVYRPAATPRTAPPIYNPNAPRAGAQSYRNGPILARRQAQSPAIPRPQVTPTALPPVYRPTNSGPPQLAPATAPAFRPLHASKAMGVQRMKEEKQPLITNFFPFKKSDQKTNAYAPRNSEPFAIEDVEITCGGEGEYTAMDGNRELGELTLYEDNKGRYWINNIAVKQIARRRGIAIKLIKKAIEDHGTIFASTQTAEDDDNTDTRHLTSEGSVFVLGCIKKGLKVKLAMPDCK
jgi:hypothetical protein